MSNYITISGASIWVLLGLLALILIALVALGVSYVKAERDKEHYQTKYRCLVREYSLLQLDAELRGRGVIGNRSEE